MKTSIRRSLGLGVAALAMVGTGLATAPAASASTSDCPREYVCVWNNTSFSGVPTWKSKNNLSNLYSANGISIMNNGIAWPGADHIWYKATWSNGGATTSGCLHYPPGGNKVRLTGPITLNWAKWGGEC
ncbi:peptidase inhibitor family I36 protein [Streptomyces sp. NPDC003697]